MKVDRILRGIRATVLRVLALSLALVGLDHASRAQWQGLGYPLEFSEVWCLYEDTADDALLVAGPLYVYFGTDSMQCSILRYRQGVWDTLAYTDFPAYSIVRYQDTLIAAGAFTSINDSAASGAAYFDGANWHAYGTFDAAVRKLAVLDGVLYAAGNFVTCDGHPATGIAFRSANEWLNLGMLPTSSTPFAWDVESYEGNIIVSGTLSGPGYDNLFRYDGTSWNPIATGILGSIAAGTTLESFGDDLIVGGTIDIAAGNAGHAIMGWDGAQFYNLNIGPQFVYNSYQYYYRVNALQNYGGKLVAGGGFNYADLVPASRIASWDGQFWCGLGGYIGGEVRALGTYHDTLIVATWGDQDFAGIDCNNLAAFIGPDLSDTCALGTTIAEVKHEAGAMLYPNPTGDVITIVNPFVTALIAEIRSLDGRLIERTLVPSGSSAMDISQLPSSSYLITLANREGLTCLRQLLVVE